MLTRKCQQTVLFLFEERDFNVRFTVAVNAIAKSRFTSKTEIEGVWKEYLRDSIGEVLNTDKQYWVNMVIVKDLQIKKIEATLSGRKIGDTFSLPLILEADGIRVTITHANGKKLSWIVVKP